jgi:hypothetical protein
MTEWDLKPEEIKKILKKMIWSFSRVNASDCKFSWYLHYIAGLEDTDNAFAQFGTIMHETLEKFLKGELDIFDVSQYYQDHYSEIVTCNFPPNKYVDLGEKAYNAGLEYFNNIDFDFERYEILGVEKELNFKVGKYPFHGFADAVYRDRETEEIILRDHKTSSFKYLKNGLISKTDAKHFLDFKRQEYLYCIPLIEEYGKVDKLTWNMVRDKRIIEIPFNEDEFKEAQEWAIEQIEAIETEVLWLPDTSSSYFCNVLCGQRNICPYRQ